MRFIRFYLFYIVESPACVSFRLMIVRTFRDTVSRRGRAKGENNRILKFPPAESCRRISGFAFRLARRARKMTVRDSAILSGQPHVVETRGRDRFLRSSPRPQDSSGSHDAFTQKAAGSDSTSERPADGRLRAGKKRGEKIGRRIACDDNGQCPVRARRCPCVEVARGLDTASYVMMRKRPITTPLRRVALIFLRVPTRR